MSVESEILRIQRNVADTYAAVAEKGGTVPLQPNSENLPAAVSSIPAGGSGSSEEVYSTDEKRIGTWIDGKILYQKGAFISNFDVKKETTYNLGDYELPAFDIIDKLIAVKGSAKRKASSGYSALLPLSGPNFDILISKTRNDWVLNAYGYEGTFDFDINVEYTKITDQPTVSADMPSMPIISRNN